MNLTAIDGKVVAYIMAFLILWYVLNLCSYGYCLETTYHPSWDELWAGIDDISMRKICDYLSYFDHVDARVSRDDLDYICQLTKHLSSYYDNVPWTLAVSVIAQESKFYQYDEYEGALGLMQLLPSYHRERVVACLEEDESYSDELFYDPRLNIMAGLDYLSQLIDECNGDISYALMCYNQGPSSAHHTYIECGITSDYAEAIIDIWVDLKALLPKC